MPTSLRVNLKLTCEPNPSGRKMLQEHVPSDIYHEYQPKSDVKVRKKSDKYKPHKCNIIPFQQTRLDPKTPYQLRQPCSISYNNIYIKKNDIRSLYDTPYNLLIFKNSINMSSTCYSYQAFAALQLRYD